MLRRRLRSGEPGRASANRKDTMLRKRSIPRLGAVLGLALLASACGSSKKDVYVERPVEELYNRAMDKFNDSNYRGATSDFDEVDRQHPYSVWATKAQL